ncbi:MAG: mycofactocin biosynthesis glycosyltransferase MftF [Acidimicrobiales bacterium]
MTLPAGSRLALDPGVRRIDGGSVLVGGSPLRILRLSPAGADVVDSLVAGEPLPAGAAADRLATKLLDAGMAHPLLAPTTAADVTVVVPVRDGQVLVRGDNVIVVDDGSRTPVPGAIRHDRPRGPAAARNTGWRAARTSFVAFIDAGCTPASDWLDVLLAHFADPSVGAVAPRVRSTGGGRLAAYETTRSPLDRGAVPGAVRPRARVPFVPSTALVVRRSVLEDLGGFDEALRFGEDVDLVWRMVERGWTVRYEPSVSVEHPARSTTWAWLRQRFDYGTSAAPLARRHPGAVAPLAVSHWSVAAWLLTALGFPVAGAAVGGTTTALLAPKLRGLAHPWREAVRLAGAGHLHAGAQIANAVRRAWWPIAIVAALGSRRARRAMLLAVAPTVVAPLGLVDDVAYGAGVWIGCLRQRSFAALVPAFSNWPGGGQAVETAPAAVTMSSMHTSGAMRTESILR